MLTPQQHIEFEERGFVRLSGAFSRNEATAMVDRVWANLDHLYGARPDTPETWKAEFITGLQPLKTDPVFQSIGSTATIGAIDSLLGAGCWKIPRHWGQFLVSFPDDTRVWNVPSDVWHTDFGFLTPSDRIFGLLVFSFLSDVRAHSGGTAVIAGSHRLTRRFVDKQPRESLEKMKRVRKALLVSDPWLKALTSKDDDSDRIERFMKTKHYISDIPVEVAELTGEPGDVILGHPWLLHTTAPNCGQHPRIMCVQRVSDSTL